MDDIKKLLQGKINEIVEKGGEKKTQSAINHEFQDYGIRLAKHLNDYSRRALYIRYAKMVPRALMESTKAFVELNYPNLPKKGKIFMWKLHEELKAYKEKHPEFEMPRMYDRKKKESKKKRELEKKKRKQEKIEKKRKQKYGDNLSLL